MSEDTPDEVKGKKPFPLRKFVIITGLCTAVGYILLFLPSPTPYPFLEYFVFPGFLLSIIGTVMLFGAWVVYSLRSQRNTRGWSLMYSVLRGGYKLMILGIIIFVVARIIQALVWPVPSELSSQANASLMQNLVSIIIGGIFWGFAVGFSFVRYSPNPRLINPIYRALTISILTVFIVNALGTLLHLNDAASYYLMAVAYSMPSYLILGIVLGYSYKRFTRTDS